MEGAATGREEDVEEDDLLVEYFSEGSVFLEMQANVWQSLGHGVARLLRHSRGAVFFRFWQDEQLIVDDVVQSVGRPRLVLRPVRGGCIWTWSDPEYADGPDEYLHAVRFASQAGSQVPRRVGGYGVRGLASPHSILGAMVVLAKMVSTSTGRS